MLASLSYVLKEDMKEELDEIVVKLLETLQSDEGIQVTCIAAISLFYSVVTHKYSPSFFWNL